MRGMTIRWVVNERLFSMYSIVSRRWYDTPEDMVVLHSGILSIQEVRKLRLISGDLVVDKNGIVIQHDKWLFDWEKKDPTCYARKAQEWDANRSGYKDRLLQTAYDYFPHNIKSIS